MAILDDVEVRIASKTTGKVLDEYDKPNTVPSTDGLWVEKFVQAETGQEIHIEVLLKSSFRFYNASGVDVRVNIDGGRVHLARHWDKSTLLRRGIKKEPSVLDTVTIKEGTQWCRMKLNFGSLDIDEDNDQEKEILAKQADVLGTIEVSLARVTQFNLSKPIPRTPEYDPGSTMNVANAIVKDWKLSHVMQPGEKTIIETPKPHTTTSRSYKGIHGRPLDFTFRYRSHMNLQLLGCIPRSPTPIPISQRTPENLTETEKAQEVTRLRVELETMEVLKKEKIDLAIQNERLAAENAGMKELKDKMTAFQTLMAGMSTGTSTSTSPSASVKRERIKEENHEERSRDSPSTRPRPSKRARTVDLTAD